MRTGGGGAAGISGLSSLSASGRPDEDRHVTHPTQPRTGVSSEPGHVGLKGERVAASAELDEADCLELIKTTTVGRIAFVGPDGLRLLPLNYHNLDDTIYFRTSEDSSLAVLARESLEVVFEVDYHDRLFQRGWSVLITGRSAPVDDPELRATLTSQVTPWAEGHRPVLVTITPSRITGRRVQVRQP